ncbi:uncharacterized protein RHO25_002379 [Cercospora beticola]|uniref:Uncharacterized protein n=1 Tax=Cercospora beticola TaxID=122368 RepID=A0ABZ0NE19_CERBT|nr:hypothetical protein RHO25_002379 [Cercospora beticola]
MSVQSSSLLGRELLQTREFDTYPSHLLRVRRLEVHLYYRESTVSDTHFLLNTFLIKLASFLMDNHSVKHLTIVVDIDEQVEESDYATILYPLRRLRGIHDVQFRGSIPDKYRIRLIDDMRSSKPAYNTLRQMRLLLEESSQHIELLESLTVQEFECDCGECPRTGDRSERLCELRRLRESVEESEVVGFLSVSEETNLQAKLGQLKDALDECSVEQLKRLFEKIEAAEKARKAATDDPSVLDQANSRGVQDDIDEGYDWSDID